MRSELLKEIRFRTSRSSGPGGQHVNKSETRVELHWNLEESAALNPEQKSLVRKRLKKRLTSEGVLILASEKTRSQMQNREDVTGKFMDLITRSIKPEKKRIPTKPTKASRERRLEEKKIRSKIKQERKKL